MSWCRLEDDMDDNRKMKRLSHEAFRLYWAAVTYARRHQTGGRMHLSDVHDVAGRHGIRSVRAAINDLLYVPRELGYEAGCWVEVATDTYQIHDFDDYNPPTSKERMAAKRARDRAAAVAASPNGYVTHGDEGVTSRPVTSRVTSDGPGDVPVTRSDSPRAQERAGYPSDTPDPVPEPVTTGLRPSVPPPTPPPGEERQTGWLLDEYQKWLSVLAESTGLPCREEKSSRDEYQRRRGEGFTREELTDAARGVALDPWWMGRNDDGVPRCNPTSTLRSPKLQTFIALARGQIDAQLGRRSGPMLLDAVAEALESGSPTPLRLATGDSA